MNAERSENRKTVRKQTFSLLLALYQYSIYAQKQLQKVA